MESTVPGLFVAGGLGGHSNGLIALVTYDGKVVADSVAQYLQSVSEPRVPQAAVEEERARLEQLRSSRSDDPVPPVRIKKMIRELMWQDVGVEKSADSLSHALDELDRIRKELVPRMTVSRTSRAFNHSWIDAIDVLNMLDACTLIAHSALNRRESRGPFIRTDYPDMDNASWLAQNILVPRPGGEFTFRVEPYELPYWRPDFERKNNLAVEW
jgi:succinate dehydrogenase/fumarate reductase flavoprotein subunit